MSVLHTKPTKAELRTVLGCKSSPSAAKGKVLSDSFKCFKVPDPSKQTRR